MGPLYQARHLFPGSNTPRGFYSFYDHILPHTKTRGTFILKGGPGTGKSTLMRRVAKQFANRGVPVEYHHCSADPHSLDAVVIDRHIAVIDGTTPHAMEPRFPGALDHIVSLGEYWHRPALKARRDEIVATSQKRHDCFQRAYRYLKAAYHVHRDIEAAYGRAMPFHKLDALIHRLTQNLLAAETPRGPVGPTRHLFGSAITPEGLVDYVDETLKAYPRAILLLGPPGTGKSSALKNIVRATRLRGWTVECFHSPLDPEKLEHVAIPSLGLIMIARERYVPEWDRFEQVIDLYSMMQQHDEKERDELKRARSLFDQLFDTAVHDLAAARALHLEMESFYSPHMDYAALDQLAQHIIEEANAAVLEGQ